MPVTIGRREVIAGLGGAAAWPLAFALIAHRRKQWCVSAWVAFLLLSAGGAMPALAQLPPSIAKQFNPSTIPVEATTSLTFTITNPNPSTTLNGVAFFDSLPTGLTVANMSTTVCGGTFMTTSPGTIQLTGSSIAANSQCQFSVSVTATAIGQYSNATGVVTSTNGGTGNFATANLTVTMPLAPSIGKVFNPSIIPLNGTTSLTFTITNPNPSTALAGVAFFDTLPTGLTIANTTATVCGGTFSTSFANTIQLVGSSIAANSTCQFSVTVTGAAAGHYTNVSGNVSSTNGGTGNSATANLTVFTLSIARTHDFNFDGTSDILLQNTGGGIAMWLMGANATIQSAVGVGSTTNVWTIIGQRDLNGDGKADILFRATDGSIAEWLMNGGTITSANGLGNPTTAWNIVGTGDFNGDGIGDILFRGGGTAVAICYMNSSGAIGSCVGVGSLTNDWTVAGTGDFNGDGVWDILWFNNTSGGVATWLMNANGTVKAAVGVGSLPAGWSIAGTGDFNADGISDILLSNTGNGVAIWFMNSSGVIGSAQGVGTMISGWTIAQTGDFNGDGKSDILWYNSASGAIAAWLLNGATVTGAVGIGSLPPSSWMILTANSE
jgi:uncharacterized repeat protein (TIGR01451 family)